MIVYQLLLYWSRSTTGRSGTTRWFVAVDVLIYYFYFSFVLGLNFIFLCFKLIIIHYHTPKQSITKFKPWIKLNHNTYTLFLCFNISLCTYFICFEHFYKSSRRPYWCFKTMWRRPCWCTKFLADWLKSRGSNPPSLSLFSGHVSQLVVTLYFSSNKQVDLRKS